MPTPTDNKIKVVKNSIKGDSTQKAVPPKTPTEAMSPMSGDSEKGVVTTLNQMIQQDGELIVLLAMTKNARSHMESIIDPLKRKLKSMRRAAEEIAIAKAEAERETLIQKLQQEQQPPIENVTTQVESLPEQTNATTKVESAQTGMAQDSTNQRVESKKQELPKYIVGKVSPTIANNTSKTKSTTNNAIVANQNKKSQDTVASKSTATSPSNVASKAANTHTDKAPLSQPPVETKPAEPVRPSYIKGNFTPQQPMAILGKTTRDRDFRQNPMGGRPGFGTKSSYGGTNGKPLPIMGTFGRTSSTSSRPSRPPSLGGRPAAADIVSPSKSRNVGGFEKKRTDYAKGGESGKKSQRTLMRLGIIQMDDERIGSRKLKNKKAKDSIKFAPQKIEKAVITTENLTVKILSEKIGKTAQEIIKQLMSLGIMCNINSVVDFETMELVANELGIELEKNIEKSKEDVLLDTHDNTLDDEKALQVRPPVVAVMGHVDHGKTSLLDTIRSTSVVTGEAGGITQHIGAYSVKARDGEGSEKTITFLDTPGHEAFTQMRKRGAQVTDIAILVVAADDGVMPQTIEAINHIKAANVSMVVAINKMDKPGANPQKIKEMLTEYGVVTTEWGGDTQMVPISAKKNEGIDKLLQEILFLAEVKELRANPTRSARGSVIEAKLDKGKGPVATILVQNGTLKVGDTVVSGLTYGRIRAMTDFMGKSIKQAGPSTAVAVLGLGEVPSAGDGIFVVENEKLAKQVISERNDKNRLEQMGTGAKATIDDIFDKVGKTLLKDLNIIIKADVHGSAEALKSSLQRITHEEVRINVIASGVGNINKSDLMLAEVSNAIIIGFGVKPDAESKAMAERNKIDIRLHSIIYAAIDDITRVVKGMEKPVYREIPLGKAEVRNIFKLSSNGVIAGSYVLSGKMVRHANARIIRNKAIVFDGKITSLKRFKEDVREVGHTYECGIGIEGFETFVLGDEIEAYNLEQTNKVVD